MSVRRFAIGAAGIVASFSASIQAQPLIEEFVPVTDEMLQNPDPSDWLMWRRTLNHWGYSPLDQINRRNVRGLQLVWTAELQPGDQEGTPLVYDGIMFFPNPNDITQAYDAATGDRIWEYRRGVPSDINDYFPAAPTNRNLAIHGNHILDNGADGYAYAIDARTGELAWETQILDYRAGAKNSSGPIVVNGKVVSGRSCEAEGGPEACVITAFDAETGEELWRTRTIPKEDEPGGDTWGDVPFEDRWHVGMWMVPSYDPELDLIYVGTSVTAPAPKFTLGGNDEQHLYHNSTLALDPDTGEIVWYYQHLVDHWDLDHAFERLIVNTAVSPDPDEVEWINPNIEPGEERKVITGIPGKTGLVYTIDRETGEFLWARPTVMQNVVADIDTRTGRAMVNPEKLYTQIGDELFICPSANIGGKNYPAGTYSPDTGVMYFPLQNACMTTKVEVELPIVDTNYGLQFNPQLAPGEENLGTVQAIDVETGRMDWKYEQPAGMLSLISTGGGLLFGGDANGRFRALDTRNGNVLWEVNLNSPVNGYPATFSVDGRQYVAISTGGSGVALSMGLIAGIPPGSGNRLYVFALPE